jgi:hypothetical protein
MGRRPAFCPPLLSNQCARTAAPTSLAIHGGKPCTAPEVSLTRLSTIAARLRDELVNEVEEEEIGGGGYASPSLLSSSRNPTRYSSIFSSTIQ